MISFSKSWTLEDLKWTALEEAGWREIEDGQLSRKLASGKIPGASFRKSCRAENFFAPAFSARTFANEKVKQTGKEGRPCLFTN